MYPKMWLRGTPFLVFFLLLSAVLSACGSSAPSLSISTTCQQYLEQQASSGFDPSDELKDLVKNLFKEEEHGGEDARLISGKRSSAADGPCVPAPNLPAAIYSPSKEPSSFSYPYDQVVSNCSAALVKYLIGFPVMVTVGTWGNNNQFQPQGTYIEPDAVSGNYLSLPEQGGQLSGSSEQESIAEAVYSEYRLSTHYYPHSNSGIFELDLPANSSVQLSLLFTGNYQSGTGVTANSGLMDWMYAYFQPDGFNPYHLTVQQMQLTTPCTGGPG